VGVVLDFQIAVEAPASGQFNMDQDLLHFEKVSNSETPLCLIRIYEWLRPTISLGVSQKMDILNHLLIAEEGVDVVKRITGGSAVLHAHELTYSVVAPAHSELFGKNLYECYQTIAKSLVRYFSDLGIEVDMNQERLNRKVKSDICFADSSIYEIQYRGKKLVGSAQKRGAKAFLQHGSLPVFENAETIARYLLQKPDSYGEASFKLADVLPNPNMFELKEKLKARFTRDFFG
jgi:lipoate-protein ligase A